MDGQQLVVLYSIIPWVGVMAAGYAFGTVVIAEPGQRRRRCLQIGGAAIALFLLLRGLDRYGDPRPWHAQAANAAGPAAMPALLAFLDTNKYPASLDFLLMTLGPTLALLPLLERARGRLAHGLEVFGCVPLFFYLLHIPLIHTLALAVSALRAGQVNPWLFENHPMGNPPAPPGYAWGFGTLYAVWLLAIVLLFFPCRWFATWKSRSASPWLRFF
jgi:uncharacterized membrane protein